MRRLLGILVLLGVLTGCSHRDISVKHVEKKLIPAEVGQMFGPTPPSNGRLWRLWLPRNTVETSKGVYNWGAVYAKLQQAELAGTRGVMLGILDHVSTVTGNSYFVDYSPSGYPTGHVLTSGGKRAYLPAYDEAAWRSGTAAFIAAFGKEFDAHPLIVAINVNTGLDGETQPIKDADVGWVAIMNQQAPGVNYRFNQWVYTAMESYAKAFTKTQLFLNNAPGGNARDERASYASKLGIGIQHSGMLPDLDSAKGYGDQEGSWDQLARYHEQIPLWGESAYGLGDASTRYWGYYAFAAFGMVAMDVHPEWFTQTDPAFIKWVEGYLGKTITTTAGVWTVLRDMEYEKQTWGTGQGVSGWPGNFEFYCQEKGGALVVPATPSGDYRERQYRRIVVSQVDIDAGFQRAAYALNITAKGPAELTVTWWTGSGYRGRTLVLPAGWAVTRTRLDDLVVGGDAEISLDCPKGVAVHLIEITETDPPTPTPTATPTSTPTSTRTATPTCTFTPTQTMTPTGTVTPTSTPMSFPTIPTQTPTKESTTPPRPTETPDIKPLHTLWLPILLT